MPEEKTIADYCEEIENEIADKTDREALVQLVAELRHVSDKQLQVVANMVERLAELSKYLAERN